MNPEELLDLSSSQVEIRSSMARELKAKLASESRVASDSSAALCILCFTQVEKKDLLILSEASTGQGGIEFVLI
jgi:hypothetical protein